MRIITGICIALCMYVGTCKASPDLPWVGAVIHHSATETGNVEIFRRYHIDVNGWDDIGYHFVILRDGTIQAGRPLSKSGAHARGRNSTHIGICLVGNDTFTDRQHASLISLLRELVDEYGIYKVERHHEECPGAGVDVEKLKLEIRN